MSLRQNLSYAFRSLRRAPLFSAAVVLTLTIGIGSAAAIFAVVNAVLLRPLPYGHPEQLVGAWFDLPPISLTHAQQTAATFFTYKRFAQTIDGIALYDDESANVSDPDGRAEPERMLVTWATSDLIPLLQVSPILGRPFTASEDSPNGPLVTVISEGLWRSRYGERPQRDRQEAAGLRQVDGDHRRDAGELPLSEQRHTALAAASSSIRTTRIRAASITTRSLGSSQA